MRALNRHARIRLTAPLHRPLFWVIPEFAEDSAHYPLLIVHQSRRRYRPPILPILRRGGLHVVGRAILSEISAKNLSSIQGRQSKCLAYLPVLFVDRTLIQQLYEFCVELPDHFRMPLCQVVRLARIDM